MFWTLTTNLVLPLAGMGLLLGVIWLAADRATTAAFLRDGSMLRRGTCEDFSGVPGRLHTSRDDSAFWARRRLGMFRHAYDNPDVASPSALARPIGRHRFRALVRTMRESGPRCPRCRLALAKRPAGSRPSATITTGEPARPAHHSAPPNTPNGRPTVNHIPRAVTGTIRWASLTRDGQTHWHRSDARTVPSSVLGTWMPIQLLNDIFQVLDSDGLATQMPVTLRADLDPNNPHRALQFLWRTDLDQTTPNRLATTLVQSFNANAPAVHDVLVCVAIDPHDKRHLDLDPTQLQLLTDIAAATPTHRTHDTRRLTATASHTP